MSLGRVALIPLLACVLLAVGCGAPGAYGPYGYRIRQARFNPGRYTVRRGDTLYSIAWRYRLDFRTLAAWNRIRPPYTIYPGRRLRLRAPAARSDRHVRARHVRKRHIRARHTPRVSHSARAPSWHWPTAGRVVETFRRGDPARRGLDIRGRLGQPVEAAAAGRVVYSGSGLPGYGQLIIIKHNDNYLSAYGYNRRLLVREGQRVRAGQRIAQMGAVGGEGPVLHFEIRRDGRPVDPLRLLPRR
jgi:lipoprotein NlpD